MLKSFFTTALRNLARNKVNAIFNIAGLAIGIAVCLFIGVWLRQELSYDRFHSQQVYRIYNTFKSESESFTQAPSGVALGAHLPNELASVKDACRVFRARYRIRQGDKQYFEDRAVIADASFFRVFGFQLTQGDPDKALIAPNNIVLTENTARRYFASTTEAMGKQLEVDGQLMTVTGIVDNAGVRSHIEFDMIVSYITMKEYGIRQGWGDIDDMWMGGWPWVYVTLENDDRWKEAEVQINDAVKRHAEKDWIENKFSYQYFLQRVEDIHLRSNHRYDAGNNGSLASVQIFGAVGLVVLLLACINYVNLSTAGATLRAKETSVRKVVGASRTQLVRQFFLETFLTCMLAVALGFLLFRGSLQPLSTWLGQTISFELTATGILTGLVFICGVTFLAGFYPAAVLSSFNPAETLKGSFIRSTRGHVLRKGLVVFQFTVTIALISSIMVIQRQMDFIRNASLGYNGDALIIVDFNGDASVAKNYDVIRNELRSSPHVLSVARQSDPIGSGLGNGWTTTENLKGEEISTSLYRLDVDADYFQTYEMKLLAGRFFIKDSQDTSRSVLVNEAAVKTFGWETPENAIGKPFGRDSSRRFVIGVVKDFNFENLHRPVEALMIGYVRQAASLSVKVDASHLREAVDHLTAVWAKHAPEVPLQYSFLDESVASQYGSEERMSKIFYGFSALSLIIGCLGLFGLAMFIVQQRTKEIGIRKVLGADVVRILAMLTGEFTRLVLVSALLATPIAWYLMREWLSGFAYHTELGWWIFASAGTIALVIALLTVGIQAFRAAMVNPVNSLRVE